MKIYVVRGYDHTYAVCDTLKAAVEAADNGDNDWNTIEVWTLNSDKGGADEFLSFDEAQFKVEMAG